MHGEAKRPFKKTLMKREKLRGMRFRRKGFTEGEFDEALRCRPVEGMRGRLGTLLPHKEVSAHQKSGFGVVKNVSNGR